MLIHFALSALNQQEGLCSYDLSIVVYGGRFEFRDHSFVSGLCSVDDLNVDDSISL